MDATQEVRDILFFSMDEFTPLPEDIAEAPRADAQQASITHIQNLLDRPISNFDDAINEVRQSTNALVIFNSHGETDALHTNRTLYEDVLNELREEPGFLGEIHVSTESGDDNRLFWQDMYLSLGLPREEMDGMSIDTLVTHVGHALVAQPEDQPRFLFIRGLEHLSADMQMVLRVKLEEQQGYSVYTYSDSQLMNKSTELGGSHLLNIFHPMKKLLVKDIDQARASTLKDLYRDSLLQLNIDASAHIALPTGFGKSTFSRMLTRQLPEHVAFMSVEDQGYILQGLDGLPADIGSRIAIIDEAQMLSLDQMRELERRYKKVIFLENESGRNAEAITAFDNIASQIGHVPPNKARVNEGIVSLTRLLLQELNPHRLRYVDQAEEQSKANQTPWEEALEDIGSLTVPGDTRMIPLPDGTGTSRIIVGLDMGKNRIIELIDDGNDRRMKNRFKELVTLWKALHRPVEGVRSGSE